MILTMLHGYPDFIGKRKAFVAYGTGPTSLPATGDVVQFPTYGNYIDFLFGGKTPDGLFSVEASPSAVGARATWKFTWKYQTTGSVASAVQNAAGSGMTPGTYTAAASGGGGTGAVIQVTVLTATTISTPIVLSPGLGYTSVPTFTPSTGGTPPTFTVSLSTVGGLVGAGANLSGEQVQVAGFCGQY